MTEEPQFYIQMKNNISIKQEINKQISNPNNLQIQNIVNNK